MTLGLALVFAVEIFSLMLLVFQAASDRRPRLIIVYTRINIYI